LDRQRRGGNSSFAGFSRFIAKAAAEGKREKGKGWAIRPSPPVLPAHANHGKVVDSMRNALHKMGRAVLPLALGVVLVGCERGKIDAGAGDIPLSKFSANISAGDLLKPRTAANRLAIYLDELGAAGYKKQIRIILPPDWGPLIYEHWFPVIRARGFKVLAILGQERRDSAADAGAAVAWIKHILPLVRSDLLGIQIVNEPANTITPQEYGAYHRQIAPLIRALAPGVPIVAGDFGVQEQGRNTLDHWKEAVAAGADDYDILSIHVTGTRRQCELSNFANRLRAFAGPDRSIWITEGDWGHLAFLGRQGLNVAENFIYTWNDDEIPALIRRPGGKLP
jgi:hypothetical protein